MKAGVNDAEAQDVVQDTIIAVAKKIEDFKYDPEVDSFKGWLLYLTRKRIALHYRKRERARGGKPGGLEPLPAAAELERIPDPAGASGQSLVQRKSEEANPTGAPLSTSVACMLWAK